ncbi:MAG TPA: MarR family transcriptional regulator, partial [Firmicutes bacterium]|nr:MarR family transcriptional regulator [Bacillota bacterium]
MSQSDNFDVDEFIRNLHLFTHLTRHSIENRLVKNATDKQLSFCQMNLLRVLDESPGLTVGDVSRFMEVSYPAATKTIDKLVKFGFIRRKEDTKDRRVSHLFLTASGKRVIDKYNHI